MKANISRWKEGLLCKQHGRSKVLPKPKNRWNLLVPTKISCVNSKDFLATDTGPWRIEGVEMVMYNFGEFAEGGENASNV